MDTVHNPIIRGFHPDPSICRVGEDFYLVTSTFEFFPGVPIFHSRNLVNWELIGHCLTRFSQLPLQGSRNSGGIYAPTIRYHDGVFYMITTNEILGGAFLVSAHDVRGEWSEPVRVPLWGIDPSLFWDDDGTCYAASTCDDGGRQAIACAAINPDTGELLSEKHILSYGCGGKYPEGPHLYKRDGWYYLMLAEGGTEYGHHETILRSRSVFGDYEPCPHNPIVSSAGIRGQGAPIQATGHADLVEDQHGRTWMICLGIRQFGFQLLHNLGRETCLAPVVWGEDGWPRVGGDDMIAASFEAELPAPAGPVSFSRTVAFEETVSPELIFVRNPAPEQFEMGRGVFTLRGGAVSLDEDGGSPALAGLRQPEFVTRFEASLDLTASRGARYGVTAYYNNCYHYDLYLSDGEDGRFLCFYKHIHDFGAELHREPIDAERMVLAIETDREEYRFLAEWNGEKRLIGRGTIAGLCTEGTMMMTFTGTILAVFCENGTAVFRDRLKLEAQP